MSSMIEDLPGPQPEIEVPEEYHSQQNNNENYNENYNEPDSRIENFDENIKLQIRKKNGIFDNIQKEFNKENLLIFIILYLATLPESNEIIRKILSSLTTNAYSHTIVTLLKCALLIVLLIVIKNYIV
jgi:hypothetical protein